MKDMVGGCCVCSDDRGWPENPLVYCDGQSCTVAVHQACYGIVTVPTGPWYCRKCESQERSVKVKCELCPSKYGALKRTDNSGWAHVVCALYIPEVRFGNVTTMEPIQLQLIPQERFNKVCYICEENGKPANAKVGACMQCNKSGCKQQFHVTCAQSLGLLCEEAGNYLDNVKYCGYCQYHYGKLKKGGNVKTIPPYKPVSTENQQSDSSSEKDQSDLLAKGGGGSSNLGKRKSSGSGKSSSAKLTNTKSAPAYQKQVSSGSTSSTSSNKASDKSGSKTNSAKSAEDSAVVSGDSAERTDRKEGGGETEKEKEVVKDSSGKGKKRKANSRTPTPNIVSEGSNQGVVSASAVSTPPPPPVAAASNPKKESPIRSEPTEKPKKAKTDSPQQPSPLTVTPQTTATNTAVSAPTASPTTAATAETVQITAAVAAVPATTTSSVLHSPQVNSVVVSVPLHNTNLSPHSVIPPPANNPVTAVLPPPAQVLPTEERKSTPTLPTSPIEEENMITSEMSGGGLKITYEKQAQQVVPMEIEEMGPGAPVIELPTKRTSRSQSADKNEKTTRTKKKNSNGMMNSLANVVTTSKRASRSQHNTPPPQATNFSGALSQSGPIKDSPPSSPSSESLGAAPSLGRKKGRKSAPASVSGSSTSKEKDNKDNIKLFQNGVNAPHMLGNQLNLNSNMAQKMSDHLNSELEAHSIFNSSESSSNLMGPQLHHRVIASARSSSAGGSSTASGGSGLSSMLGGSGGVIPQTLDQLLERQWEQGSQFLMEQAQHFDIASLISCLHQLRAENLRLEEHVSSLLQRRDHLLAVNARLAIPLTGTPASSSTAHPHTVNNIHPSVGATHAESTRSRHSSGYPHVPPSSQHQPVAMENGISPTEQSYAHQPHRSPAANPPQPSPNIRQSSGSYSSSGLMRGGNADTSSGRSAPRPSSYAMYQGPPPNSQQQMVIRRDNTPDQPPKPS